MSYVPGTQSILAGGQRGNQTFVKETGGPSGLFSPSTSCPFHFHFSSLFFFLVVILKGNERSFPSLEAAKSCGPYLNPVALLRMRYFPLDSISFYLLFFSATLGLSCGPWHLPCGVRDLSCGLSCPPACGILAPRLGIKPASPALEGEALTTGPQGSLP